jgi:hypothetical protein
MLLSAFSIAEAREERILAEMESRELTSPITLARRRSIRPKKLPHSCLEINEICSTAATTINNEIALKDVCNLAVCGGQDPRREQDIVSKWELPADDRCEIFQPCQRQ